jgi:anti-sigma factor RsiW
MNHSELQDQLFDWHDGQLPAGKASVVHAHVASCLECRTHLNDWKKTTHTFLSPLQIQDAPVFTQKVMRKIRVSQASETQVRPRFFARWAFPALALSLGSFAAMVLYVAQPTVAAADGLFSADSQTTPTEWIANIAKDDQILGSVVEKP